MRPAFTILMLSVLLAVVPSALAQEPAETLPKIVRHSEPTYPPIARTAHVQGEVRVKFTTNGESVSDAEAETGPPLLHRAAEDNVRTWKFVPHAAGTFHVTFRYKIIADDLDVAFLDTPDVVQLMVPPPEIHIQWAWVSLGTWKAELTSAHGKSRQVFKLASTLSQPDGQRVKSFLVGRIAGDRIVGTFVDDAGTTGGWTALREAEKSNAR